jgi:DNA-binding response OmpR family regulator
MKIRVLIIDDDAPYRRLLSQHVATAFDAPVIAEYDPVRQGRLPAGFVASAYDVVLLDDSPGPGTGLGWLRDLSSRLDFPPIIYLLAEPDPGAEEVVLAAGAHAVLSKRKINHAQLVDALRGALSARQRKAEEFRGSEESLRLSRFGEIVIRGYRFVRELAKNPVSSVYLAQDMRDDREVVLKVLRSVSEGGRGADDFERFLREYQIAANIRHPNIVRIFDFGVADDHAYIVMEYFPRGDLRQRIKEGIEPDQALAYLRQMAEALDALHSHGVLHRDLKPGNVMLRDDGSVVLIDFGLSKQIDLTGSITGSGEIFGTPYYMSPEQGHGKDTDTRSDIYSLGVIFYEMLAKRKPYVAGTPMQVIYKHAHSPLPELPAEVKRFEFLVVNCMAKDPGRRYPTAERLADEVKDMQRDSDEQYVGGV